MDTLHQPHDALLRHVFSSEAIVQDLVIGCLQQLYPALANAKLSDFRVVKNSFVNEKFKKFYGDLVCSLKIDGTRVVLPVEIESELKKDMPKRVGQYAIGSAIDLRNKKTGQLPITIPIVLHVGTKAYNFHEQFMDVPSIFQCKLLSMSWVISIGQQSMQKTMQYGPNAISLVIVNQAHKGSPLAFLEKTPEAAKLFIENQFSDHIAHYISHMETKNSKKGEEETDLEIVKQRIIKLAADKTTIVMSGLARIEKKIREEGIQEGRQEGIQEGIRKTAKEMFRRAYSLDLVKEVTGLDRGELVRLQGFVTA
jgi:predicted transposase YdaD